MKKLLRLVLVFVWTLGFWQGSLFAGDFYIERVDYDGECLKVVYGSTEDDSHDKGKIRVRVFIPATKKDVFRSERSFTGLSGGGHYVEFCGPRARPQHCAAYVQIFHNRKLEDQASWGVSRR